MRGPWCSPPRDGVAQVDGLEVAVEAQGADRGESPLQHRPRVRERAQGAPGGGTAVRHGIRDHAAVVGQVHVRVHETRGATALAEIHGARALRHGEVRAHGFDPVAPDQHGGPIVHLPVLDVDHAGALEHEARVLRGTGRGQQRDDQHRKAQRRKAGGRSIHRNLQRCLGREDRRRSAPRELSNILTPNASGATPGMDPRPIVP